MTSSKRPREDESSPSLSSLNRPISPPPKRPRKQEVISSPWQLTWIRDLPESDNGDAVTLKDLLGDPLISECWEFNYLHDINFLMEAFDPDTRHLVKVHVVHGFWKREDPQKQRLEIEAAEYPNVELHVAPMPEMFGTHHSKMMVLFRHDDTAQVIIHTANMIAKDWTNMTNAVWASPRLPRMPALAPQAGPPGTGGRFKSDLIKYLHAYDARRPTCKALADQLAGYDFSEVRGALIASVPGRHGQERAAWGWPALKRHMNDIPLASGPSEIVVQISSIATLGAVPDWLQKTLFSSLAPHSPKPEFKVVFPTAEEIRKSLDGYVSGGSIHTKIQSAQQARQLEYLRPIFHHWTSESRSFPQTTSETSEDAAHIDGGRDRAAPHIKTYIRYNGSSIDWALLTSANLSKQAWGDAAQPSANVRIASWEMGVLVWPGLWGGRMVPVFKRDAPEPDPDGTIIGVRVPYSLPLQRYGPRETPWVATMEHREPDCKGHVWLG